jgi:Do/DeqQ family serine protease
MRRTWLIFSQAVTIALAVLFVVATLKPDWLGRGTPARPDIVSITESLTPSRGEGGAAGPVASYAAAAQRAAPAVVSISASRPPPQHPGLNDPWFRYFFGEQLRRYQQPQVGLGSGVIVSAEGYLLTNHHVVDGAADVEVMLSDGRRAQARIVGSDPETDLAVLRIDLDNLPTIAFAKGEAIRVGDVVLAIGNPYNLGQTVTSGIVSALNRGGLGINTYENFIQTDAAINPGNSGGALVDAYGNLVGINTAIYTRSGGFQGIGLAVPADTARQVLDALIRDGTVVRGWIGAELGDISPELAAHLRIAPDTRGALIRGVLASGPAGKAGLRPADVVQSIDGQPILNSRDLLNAVGQARPGSEARLGVLRQAQTMELSVDIGQRPPPQRTTDE